VWSPVAIVEQRWPCAWRHFEKTWKRRKVNLSKRLLIVDDEPNLLRAVAACLRGEGYEVETARSGEEALVHIAQRLPDLIVSDIRMPRMDGYAFARQLRGNPRTDLIPIIFLTAKDESSDRIAGIRSGVDAYLTKPFEPDELIAVIENILARVERTHTEIARLIGSNQREPASFVDEELTEAERRIATAVAAGLSNKDIASDLGISVRTVENHISHILAKKNFDNRVEIARYVLGRHK
jgi:DNA-binding NarL/FixJ family response regulator